MLIYTAGKYSGDTDANIAVAREHAKKLWEAGHAVICPHLNTAHMEKDCLATYEDYIAGDLKMIARCDAIYMLPNWEDSKGAVLEHAWAQEIGLPIYLSQDGVPPLHPTEVKYPVQVKAYINEIMRGYRTHLSKNADYSPANVAGPGEIGIATRIWDKCVRLMNLTGFDIQVTRSEFRAGKEPSNESIEDTYIDLHVYGVIGKLHRKGLWGK